MRRILLVTCLLAIVPGAAFPIEKPIEPDKVAPEYRDAAERRRAELVRQKACWLKAEKQKVAKRDAAHFVVECMEAAEKAEQVEIGPRPKGN